MLIDVLVIEPDGTQRLETQEVPDEPEFPEEDYISESEALTMLFGEAQV